MFDKQKLGILRSGQTVELQYAFEALFKSVWADNADVISLEYSGTGALKTDYTRTGKRTQLGALRDGVNSLTRYFKNNFADGFRQVTSNILCVSFVSSALPISYFKYQNNK